MTGCPTCGRYAGPNAICPYCGSPLDTSLTVRTLKVGSLVLAFIGVCILLFSAQKRAVPHYAIGDLNPAMNFAYVHVAGTVSRQPDIDAGSGALAFWMDDGTGELYVSAYRQEAQTLVVSGRVPRLGDRVELEGTLRLREDYNAITINLPEKLTIDHPLAELAKIGVLDKAWEGRSVRVEGLVRSIRKPYSGLTLVELRDETGSIEAAIPEEMFDPAGGTRFEDPKPGESLRVEGIVTLYRGDPQITLTHPGGVERLPEVVDPVPHREIVDINADDAGRMIRLSGVILSVKPFSAGTKLVLDDGSGTIDVVLWQDFPGGAGDLEPGLLVEVTGEIAFYQGAAEIIPETGADIQVTGRMETPEATPTQAYKMPEPTQTPHIVTTATVSVSPTLESRITVTSSATLTPTLEDEITSTPTIPTPIPMAITSLGQIDQAAVGQVRTVRAEVVDAASIPSGFKFTLDDGSGRIVLLLWADVYAGVGDRYGLRPGAEVHVTGEVGIYEGEMQIEPEPAGVLVLQAGWGPPAETVPTGSAGEHLGGTVRVQGQVVSSEAFGEDNLRLYVDDGSGAVQVILWNNVRGLVPDEWTIVGVEIQVTGEVGEYRSAVQVTPALPVYVLPASQD